MTYRLALVVAVVALASCGSDGDGNLPTLSTPPPPITIPLNGSYDLVIVPAKPIQLLDNWIQQIFVDGLYGVIPANFQLGDLTGGQ